MRRLIPYTILTLAITLLGSATAFATTHNTLNYQGQLSDAGGSFYNGPVTVVFNIYPVETGGSSLWTESHALNVTNGLFSVVLGSTTPFPAGLFQNSPLWMGITVGTDPELTPRTILTSAPYSLHSLSTQGFNPGPDNIDSGLYSTIGGDSNTVKGDYGGVLSGYGNEVNPINGADTILDTSGAPAATEFPPARFPIGIGTVITGGTSNQAIGWNNAVGAGCFNLDSAAFSFISGGLSNQISALAAFSFVGAGYRNIVTDRYSFIGGGAINRVDNGALFSGIGAGLGNKTENWFAWVGGGLSNRAVAQRSTVGGGDRNIAWNNYATVSGGWLNNANGLYSAIGGGFDNLTNADATVVGGGEGNSASGQASAVSGGRLNTSSGFASNVGGGSTNQALGDTSVVAGGSSHAATGVSSVIGGGYKNNASGQLSTIGGGTANTTVEEATTVSGGKGNAATRLYATVGGGTNNRADDTAATIGGGIANSASGEAATVGGGFSNAAVARAATVAGGDSNVVTLDRGSIAGGSANLVLGVAGAIGGGAENIVGQGSYSTVPGGFQNEARGDFCFAAGVRAKAIDSCSFVWADCCIAPGQTNSSPYLSSLPNSYNARATNGFYFLTTCDSVFDPATGVGGGVYVPPGGSMWLAGSDLNLKRNLRPVDEESILDKVSRLPISRWSYKAQDETIEHIGPTAQDFYATFGVGDNNTSIGTLDPSGVALAAIKELKKENTELKEKVEKLAKMVEELVESRR